MDSFLVFTCKTSDGECLLIQYRYRDEILATLVNKRNLSRNRYCAKAKHFVSEKLSFHVDATDIFKAKYDTSWNFVSHHKIPKRSNFSMMNIARQENMFGISIESNRSRLEHRERPEQLFLFEF